MSLCNPMDNIFDNFYIGNSFAARDEGILRASGITAVVNVAKDLNDPWFNGIKSFKFGLVDGQSSDNNVFLYQDAAELVIELLHRGEVVLLHCHEGISRSVAVGSLVTAELQKMTLNDAYHLIQSKRPLAFINSGHHQMILDAWDKMNATG